MQLAHKELADIQAKVQVSQQELQTARHRRDKAKQDADEAQLALKSSTVRSVDVSQALELATADRHSIISNEGFEADLESLQTQADKHADSQDQSDPAHLADDLR